MSGLEMESQCELCPNTKYCTGGKITSGCAAGYWCDFGAKSATDPTKICPAGFYCEDNAAKPIPCGANTFSIPGSTQASNCADCPIGYFCKGNSVLECPPGHYCPIKSSDPIQCPSGTFRKEILAGVASDCIPCTEGHYCNIAGIGDEANFPCPPGHYCLASDTTTAEPCPAGTYRYSNLGKTLADCSSCPSGHYCPVINSSGTVIPIICSPGYYCLINSAD
jgi:hypothetical protein